MTPCIKNERHVTHLNINGSLNTIPRRPIGPSFVGLAFFPAGRSKQNVGRTVGKNKSYSNDANQLLHHSSLHARVGAFVRKCVWLCVSMRAWMSVVQYK